MTRRKARAEADQLKIKFLQDQLAAATLRANKLTEENKQLLAAERVLSRDMDGTTYYADGTAHNQMGVNEGDNDGV